MLFEPHSISVAMKPTPLILQTILLEQTVAPTRSAASSAPELPYLESKVRSFAKRYRLFDQLRVLSSFYWFGPWRGLAIRYHQWRNRNQPLPQTKQTLFPQVAHRETAAQINAKGLALGLQLPESEIEAILAYCARHGANVYHNHDLTCPALRDIVHDPALLAVAREYLGAEPRLHSTRLYWTHPPTGEAEQQRLQNLKARFHYDLSDFKALIVFFYLTDVAADCGPHVTIQGTHRHKTLRQMLTRFLTDQAAQTQYGDRITTITGPRGSGFFTDIACYHKHAYGTRDRLMMSITYVLQRRPEPRVPITY